MPERSAGEFGDFKLPPGMGKLVIVGVIVLVVIFAAGGVFGTVGAGQRGVLLHFGAVTETIYEAGLYYKIPFVQEVVLMSTQIQKYTAPATSSSKDLQVV
ncbi:MAG: SPFH domain-containing protein, partial [Acidobacteria bacterium]|nr:SPFH domain-containing protein [Acidobacteriota bacterium]